MKGRNDAHGESKWEVLALARRSLSLLLLCSGTKSGRRSRHTERQARTQGAQRRRSRRNCRRRPHYSSFCFRPPASATFATPRFFKSLASPRFLLPRCSLTVPPLHRCLECPPDPPLFSPSLGVSQLRPLRPLFLRCSPPF